MIRVGDDVVAVENADAVMTVEAMTRTHAWLRMACGLMRTEPVNKLVKVDPGIGVKPAPSEQEVPEVPLGPGDWVWRPRTQLKFVRRILAMSNGEALVSSRPDDGKAWFPGMCYEDLERVGAPVEIRAGDPVKVVDGGRLGCVRMTSPGEDRYHVWWYRLDGTSMSAEYPRHELRLLEAPTDDRAEGPK